MSNINKSNTPVAEKDYWRTPPELINDALGLLNINGFDTDVCCSNSNVKINKAEAYISEQQDALQAESWFLFGRAGNTSFCNPPFSNKWLFFQKAVEQSRKWSKQVLMVMPYRSCTTTWVNNVHDADCIIYLPDGRYQFLLPDGSKPKSSCNFETCLVLIVQFKCGNVIVNYKRGCYA